VSAGTRGAAAPSGRRQALCIGINAYATIPLSGCVNDARNWERWLQGQGFQTRTLFDQAATLDGMLAAMRQLIQSSSSGDIIAIQYSGHGTQLPSTNADEPMDEALVPIDYAQSGCLIDDDVAEICNGIPDGVSVTFFMDCCHAGTNTRLFLGAATAMGRARFMPPYPAMIEAHLRARAGRARGVRGAYSGSREVLFAACQSDQSAYESAGQGDFTRHALEVLRSSPPGMTNNTFIAQVKNAFGSRPRQNPELWSDPSLLDQPLLGARTGGGGDASGSPDGLLAQLEALLQLLRARYGR
jgi:hypothetical protein